MFLEGCLVTKFQGRLHIVALSLEIIGMLLVISTVTDKLELSVSLARELVLMLINNLDIDIRLVQVLAFNGFFCGNACHYEGGRFF